MTARAKKVGVLTFHKCINYGSYWQARCLVEALRARGHDAELLDHDCRCVRRAEAHPLLGDADLVKFAKWRPDPATAGVFMGSARDLLARWRAVRVLDAAADAVR